MSRFLLLNFEDFGLNQDIMKMIQPFNPFCMCCLDREGPMINLDKCQHRDYLDAFDKPQLKQFNQLVCLQCHSLLKKIKCFQLQILETYETLLSGAFTDSTINNKRLHNMIIQKVVDDLHLPSEETNDVQPKITSEDVSNDIEDMYNGQLQEVLNEKLIHDEVETDLNMKDNATHELLDRSNTEEMFTNNTSTSSNIEENFNCDIQTTSNLEENFSEQQDTLNIAENYTFEIRNSPNVEVNFTAIPNSSNMEDNHDHEQNRLHKNIKTALEILERNNQTFVMLGSQLQFLNGEHLSFLEPSLLSKEILTDIPLVPAKNLGTDLDNGLLNNTKAIDIEIDGPEKMFYDSLDLSPVLMQKELNTPDKTEFEIDAPIIVKETEPKTKTRTMKSMKKKERKLSKNKILLKIKKVKLSQDELNRERVLQAQSDAYLRYKFRCETCIIGFNYKENLEDHTKRKHGQVEGDNVVCDICSQVIPTPGSVTEHKYRHYTRYVCVQCNTRHHTHDEAVTHAVRCNGAKNNANALLKTQPPAFFSLPVNMVHVTAPKYRELIPQPYHETNIKEAQIGKLKLKNGEEQILEKIEDFNGHI